MNFLASLLSKKLGFAAATSALISQLPMSADSKGIALAAVAIAYIVAQAYLDAHSVAQPDEPGPGPEPEE